MKKNILLLSAIALLSFGIINEEKKFKVELTPDQWGSRFNWIQVAMTQLKKSNGPANEVLPLCDSLQKFSNELLAQLQPQFQAAADTTKKKK